MGKLADFIRPPDAIWPRPRSGQVLDAGFVALTERPITKKAALQLMTASAEKSESCTCEPGLRTACPDHGIGGQPDVNPHDKAVSTRMGETLKHALMDDQERDERFAVAVAMLDGQQAAEQAALEQEAQAWEAQQQAAASTDALRELAAVVQSQDAQAQAEVAARIAALEARLSSG